MLSKVFDHAVLMDRFCKTQSRHMCSKQKSGPDLSARTTHLYPQFFALLPPCSFRSARRIASSAISFRLPSDSISAAASSDSPLSSAFASDVSGPSIPRLSPLPFRFLTPAVSAFFRPLQFWVLTTRPLLFLSFSSRFRLADASPVPDSALASSVSPFSPA